MEILIVVVAIVVLAAGAVASAGAFGGMPAEPVRDTYAPALPDGRPVRGDDLDGVRFGVSARGYDMEQVDALMTRMAQQLGRDEELPVRAAPSTDEPSAEKSGPQKKEPETKGPGSKGSEKEGPAMKEPEKADRTDEASAEQGRSPQGAATRARAWRGREVDLDAEARDWRPED